ncbi:MAG: hypothetical protein HFJ50_02985 [Clostridia bacterium]|nr:hypothetical protein [Clostridia bacterium]
MQEITGTSIGFIQVEVFKTENNLNFFYLQANNGKVLPVLDFLDSALEEYKPDAIYADIKK